MKFLHANPPQFSIEQAKTIAAEYYAVTTEPKKLYSERDLNFYFPATEKNKTNKTDGFILKIANEAEEPDVIDCQIRLFQHLAITAPDLPVPNVIKTKSGQDSFTIKNSLGKSHAVYALSYLVGDLAHHAFQQPNNLNPELILTIGRKIAQLGRAMSGFFHPASFNRELLWDIRLAERYLDKLQHLGSPELITAAERIFPQFINTTLPQLKKLRAQVIHGDVHEHNLLVSVGTKPEVKGIIDFGDVMHAPLLFDLCDSLADFLTHSNRIELFGHYLVKGYAQVTKLEEAEIVHMVDLVHMRMLFSLVVNAWRSAQTPDEPNYLAGMANQSVKVFLDLQTLGREKLEKMFRMAAGVPTKMFFDIHNQQPLNQLIERRKKFMGSHLYVFYQKPLNIVRGDGVWLYDAMGKRYMDCYNNVPIVGHCHPYVVNAITQQANILNTNTRYLSHSILHYAERLSKKTGGELSSFAFVNSGSEANDVAWRMAMAWAEVDRFHAGVLCQEFAYHGITEAIDAVSPSADRLTAAKPHVRTIMAPDDYRGQFGKDGRAYAKDVDRAIASLRQANLKPIAYFLDSAFVTNGILEPMPHYVEAVFQRVRAAGGLCIGDEVQSGFGRMGDYFWGYQHHKVIPDIITIGKPAGNGHPLGIVITRPEIYEKFIKTSAFFSTFGGNNVSVAAGLATLDVIEQSNLVSHASHMGKYLKTKLEKYQTQYPIIGKIRATGLAIGIEIVSDQDKKTPDKELTDRLINQLCQLGVLVAAEGEFSSLIKMRPPLIFTKEHADFFLDAFEQALKSL